MSFNMEHLIEVGEALSTAPRDPPSAAKEWMLTHLEGQPLAKAVHEAFQDPVARERFHRWLCALGCKGTRELLKGVKRANWSCPPKIIDEGMFQLFRLGAARLMTIITVDYAAMSREEAELLCAPRPNASVPLCLSIPPSRCSTPIPTPSPTPIPTPSLTSTFDYMRAGRQMQRATCGGGSGVSSPRLTASWRLRAPRPWACASGQRRNLTTP